MRRASDGWFSDARIGVLISWGPFSVPAFAATPGDAAIGSAEWFTHHPDASWYLNGLRHEGSPVREYHRAHFGMHAGYGALARRFAELTEGWDPSEWIDTFKESGARYVVAPAMDLDGYLMWPGTGDLRSDRDFVTEIGQAVRSRGLRFGVSYSAAVDWVSQTAAVGTLAGLRSAIPSRLSAAEFGERTGERLLDLISRVSPDLIHTPSGPPTGLSLGRLLKETDDGGSALVWSGAWSAEKRLPDERALRTRYAGGQPVTIDLRTPTFSAPARGLSPQVPVVRYGMPSDPPKGHWHYLHVPGSSLGDASNRADAAGTGGTESLVHTLARVASLGGNLLIAVSPTAGGALPAFQREELAQLARWLRSNSEAIYGTRPFSVVSGKTDEQVEVRYTMRRDALYAIVLGRPASLAVDLPGLDPRRVPQPAGFGQREFKLVATVLEADREVEWRRSDKGIRVDIPGSFVPEDAMVIRFRWQL